MAYDPNFTEQFFINRHDADFMGRLKPGSLLRFAQQLATDQNTKLGFTNDFYVEHQLAYLLARQTLVFSRVPVIDETLTMTTVPEQSKHAVNKRLTLVNDEQGNEVACVDSRWVLVDAATRHILRHGSPLLEPHWNADVARTLDQTIPKAQTTAALAPRHADYLLCDLNGHINNCAYADLACASVPLDTVRQAPIRRLSIVYHREVPLGEMLSLASGTAENGWYTVGTKAGGDAAFEAWCCV
ncbi:MAG: thioesterase [Faecalibacterium sp.]|jgi:acyl-ACP thioesterase|nr:thioesterase [Faecalibacterium sp.]